MKTYKQLSQAQRYQIEILKKAGKDQKEMAALLGVSAATISRELKRNQGKKGYRPTTAWMQEVEQCRSNCRNRRRSRPTSAGNRRPKP